MSVSWELVVTLVLGVLGASALWKFLEFLLTRKDKKKDDLDTIKKNSNETLERVKTMEIKIEAHDVTLDNLSKKVDAIESGQEERKAATARVQILRFADELADGKDFAKGHYEDIYEAMKIYNDYCAAHPDFKNELTVDAQNVIRRKYEEHSLKHNFKQYAQGA